MDKEYYSSGELARLVGLSLRTIQYYDNIGLLPSSGRNQAGRRQYQAEDLLRLEQIVIYKKLNFSLEQIKEALLSQDDKPDLLALFQKQHYMLLEQMESLHTSYTAIEIMAKLLETREEVSFANLLRAFQILPQTSIFKQVPDLLGAEEEKRLRAAFKESNLLQNFYHSWKEAIMEALILQGEGLVTASPEAQNMAGRWWAALEQLSENLPDELAQQIHNLHLEEHLTQNQADLQLANQYLEEALTIYLERR